MHEENFLSSWLREEGTVKEEKKTPVQEKEENETLSAKEGVSIRFLRRSLTFLVKGKMERVVVVSLGGSFGRC